MNRHLWIGVTVLLLLCLLLAILSAGSMVKTVGGGAEGAKALEEGLAVSASGVLAEDPPVRVFAMLPAAEGAGWRWKVEGTLLPGRTPGDPEVARVTERISFRCLAAPIGGKAPAGLLLLLHVPGKADWTREFDGEGRPR